MAPTTPSTRPAPQAPRIVWAGLAVVLAAAAVLSFDALRGLALAVAIPAALAWLLPIAVDAGAAVSCATWLGNRTPVHAARFAGRMTWALLAVTVAGNAGQLGMHAHGIVPPWWVAVLVGTIPPAIVGAVVHLVVLLVRRSETTETADRPVWTATVIGDEVGTAEVVDAPRRDVEPAPGLSTVQVGEQPRTAGPDPLVPAVREWLGQQTGTPSQRQLRTEFGVGADRAKKLMEAAA